VPVTPPADNNTEMRVDLGNRANQILVTGRRQWIIVVSTSGDGFALQVEEILGSFL